MTGRIIALRGISGAGKTHFQKTVYPDAESVSTDHLFEGPDGYQFERSRMDEALFRCFHRGVQMVDRGVPLICVDNVNARVNDLTPWFTLAGAYGYDFEVITLLCKPTEAFARTIHPQPIQRLQRLDQVVRAERLPAWWKHRTIGE